MNLQKSLFTLKASRHLTLTVDNRRKEMKPVLQFMEFNDAVETTTTDKETDESTWNSKKMFELLMI